MASACLRAERAGAGGGYAATRGPERRRRAGRGARAQRGARLAPRVAPARLGPHPVRAGPRLRAPRRHVRLRIAIPIRILVTQYTSASGLPFPTLTVL